MSKGFFVHIPEWVLTKGITSTEKMVFGLVVGLSNEKGYCFASNEKFAEILNLSAMTIKRSLKKLEDNNLIFRNTKQSKAGSIRKIFIKSQENSEGMAGVKDIQPGVQSVPVPGVQPVPIPGVQLVPMPGVQPVPIELKGLNTSINTKKNNNTSANKFTDESIELQSAQLLFKMITNTNPKYKKPDLQKWADVIRLMIERDKRETEDIRKVIVFAQTNNFWQSNILSTQKLREKFDMLMTQMLAAEKQTQGGQYNANNQRNKPQQTKQSNFQPSTPDW